MPTNEKFEIRGINHLALVCRDMKKTVEFYSGVLGLPLTKTIELPRGAGQHFFFDIGWNPASARMTASKSSCFARQAFS